MVLEKTAKQQDTSQTNLKSDTLLQTFSKCRWVVIYYCRVVSRMSRMKIHETFTNLLIQTLPFVGVSDSRHKFYWNLLNYYQYQDPTWNPVSVLVKYQYRLNTSCCSTIVIRNFGVKWIKMPKNSFSFNYNNPEFLLHWTVNVIISFQVNFLFAVPSEVG